MLNNQSYLEYFGLIEELNEQATEKISGGYEFFALRNKTGYAIEFTFEGVPLIEAPNEVYIYTTYSGGGVTIEFDADIRTDYKQLKKYTLTNGVYEFQNDPSPDNLYDIDLYFVG
ncbi:MAG: hypothetical protein KME55_25655 [Nostoc indistinguendum CM1-VF10]|nr:hypothetical protein [Nostoc indistinguendum CM1-VF10]